AGATCLWVIFVSISTLNEKRVARQFVVIKERDTLLADEKSNFERMEKTFQLQHKACALWLQETMNKVPSNLLLLDHRQRVAAVNAQALQQLGIPMETDVLGKSWQDLPGLSACGSSLVESLETPGSPVRRIDGTSGRVIEFCTMRSEDEGSGGTWVRFIVGLL